MKLSNTMRVASSQSKSIQIRDVILTMVTSHCQPVGSSPKDFVFHINHVERTFGPCVTWSQTSSRKGCILDVGNTLSRPVHSHVQSVEMEQRFIIVAKGSGRYLSFPSFWNMFLFGQRRAQDFFRIPPVRGDCCIIYYHLLSDFLIMTTTYLGYLVPPACSN